MSGIAEINRKPTLSLIRHCSSLTGEAVELDFEVGFEVFGTGAFVVQ